MKAGTRLATRDGTRVGNAIIVSVATDNFGHEKYFVETDFGNEMVLNFNELDFYFSINLNSTVEPDAYERWVRDRDELRSRSSMAEQGTVDAQDVGSVPTVTANDVIAEANNSLYGSQNFFLSTNGGPPDKYHLARPIETLKESSRKMHVAVQTLAQALVDVEDPDTTYDNGFIILRNAVRKVLYG